MKAAGAAHRGCERTVAASCGAGRRGREVGAAVASASGVGASRRARRAAAGAGAGIERACVGARVFAGASGRNVAVRAESESASVGSNFDTSKVRIGDEGIIINAYAESLLSAANDAGASVLEKVATDMDALEAAVADEAFVAYILNPVIEFPEKVVTIKESAKALGWHEFTVNVLEILLSGGRAEVIPDLPYAFKTLLNAMSKTMRVEVISSVKMTNDQTFKIVQVVQKMTGASNVKCKNLVDPNVQAGLVVKYGEDLDSLIDLTITKDLAQMLRTFETEISGAFWDSIGAEDDFPKVVKVAELNEGLDVDEFAQVCAGNAYLNDQFLQGLDANERQLWSDKISMA